MSNTINPHVGSSPIDTGASSEVYTAPQPTAIDQVNTAIDQAIADGVDWAGNTASSIADWASEAASSAGQWAAEQANAARDYISNNKEIFSAAGDCVDAIVELKPGQIARECSDLGDAIGKKAFVDSVEDPNEKKETKVDGY
ncbi:MAG TPA: hypothetical protein VGF45_21615 [Polyangia bacterium]